MTVPVEGSAEVHLEELLKGVAFLALEGDPLIGTSIRMVTCDSREVTAGSLFVAIKGYCTDGGRFISSAVERGAAAVICEEFPPDMASSCLYIQVSDARKALAEAARIFYGKASDRLLIIGVTGTNGKTTTAKLITAMLNANGISAGYIGTNLCRIGELDIPLDRTTPEAPGLHALFSQMVEAGCRAAVMEVSSHALVLQRVFGIRFHAALFTNLTLEHLDFHGSMQEYAAAKQQLFDQLSPEGFAVFNGDDPWAEGMAARVGRELQTHISQNQPKMLVLNKQVMLSVDTHLDNPEARRVTFYTGGNNIFYLELAVDGTEFIKLFDFESVEVPDPDKLFAQANAASAAAPSKPSSNDTDDLLKSLDM